MSPAPDRFVFGVVLAAGASSRFEHGHKLLSQFEGHTLLRRVCDAVAASSLDQAIVVLGADAGSLHQECESAGVPWLKNEIAHQGQSTSLRLGLTSVPPEAMGCLLLPADQPLLDQHHIDQVLSVARRLDSVVHATASEEPTALPNIPHQGPPVYFPRRYFGQLERAEGDQGGRQIIRTLSPAELSVVELPAEALFDVDTIEDLATLEAHRNVRALR